MAATKKTSESFTTKKVGDLVVGDRFRELNARLVQEIVSVEKKESPVFDTETGNNKILVFCKTKVEGAIEEYHFSAFSDLGVEVLNV